MTAGGSATTSEVLVERGIYRGHTTPETASQFYPTSTTDIVKLLRAEGVTVRYADPSDERQELSLNAAEWILPVLVSGAFTLASGVLSNVISRWLESRARSDDLVHLKVGRVSDEEIEWFEADGSPDHVVRALDSWSKNEDSTE